MLRKSFRKKKSDLLIKSNLIEYKNGAKLQIRTCGLAYFYVYIRIIVSRKIMKIIKLYKYK